MARAISKAEYHRLPLLTRAAVYAAIAEVLAPEFIRFAVRTKRGDKDVFRECLDFVWSHLAGPRAEERLIKEYIRYFGPQMVDSCAEPDYYGETDPKDGDVSGAAMYLALRECGADSDEKRRGPMDGWVGEQGLTYFLSDEVLDDVLRPADWDRPRVEKLRAKCIALQKRVDWEATPAMRRGRSDRTGWAATPSGSGMRMRAF